MSVVILSSPMSNIIIYKVSLEEFIFVILVQHLICVWINIVSSCFNNMDEIGNYQDLNWISYSKQLGMRENSQQQNFFALINSAPQTLNQSIQENLSLRMKFPTETDKFYPSEQLINQTLTGLQSALEQTQQAPDTIISSIIDSKILIPLLKTLEHPNLDINISAINLFFSLIIDLSEDIEQAEKNQKEQNGEDSNKAFKQFFRMNVWLIENGLVESLFRVMNKIDEQKIEEYEAFRKILKIFESLIELSNQVYPIMIRDTPIISFFANRIMPNFTVSHRVIDDNKYIVSDILVALLQTPELEPELSAVHQFYKSFGIEVLIETISSYENKLPTEIDERQYLSNLFDCLNIMLVSVRETRSQFIGMKGCYLMISYVCAKTEYAVAALKAVSNGLDYEEQDQKNIAICEEIVNDGSLKYLFPILMMQGLKGTDTESQQEINEHILKIVYFLLKNSQGVTHDRVMFKFTEKRFAKLERVFQLLAEIQDDAVNMTPMNPTTYIKMVKDLCLGSAQLCAKIIATIWDQQKTKQKIVSLFKLYSIKMQVFKDILQTHYQYVDEGKEKEYLAKLLSENLRSILESVSK